MQLVLEDGHLHKILMQQQSQWHPLVQFMFPQQIPQLLYHSASVLTMAAAKLLDTDSIETLET